MLELFGDPNNPDDKKIIPPQPGERPLPPPGAVPPTSTGWAQTDGGTEQQWTAIPVDHNQEVVLDVEALAAERERKAQEERQSEPASQSRVDGIEGRLT
jgi:hypothetical protein